MIRCDLKTRIFCNFGFILLQKLPISIYAVGSHTPLDRFQSLCCLAEIRFLVGLSKLSENHNTIFQAGRREVGNDLHH